MHSLSLSLGLLCLKAQRVVERINELDQISWNYKLSRRIARRTSKGICTLIKSMYHVVTFSELLHQKQKEEKKKKKKKKGKRVPSQGLHRNDCSGEASRMFYFIKKERGSSPLASEKKKNCCTLPAVSHYIMFMANITKWWLYKLLKSFPPSVF